MLTRTFFASFLALTISNVASATDVLIIYDTVDPQTSSTAELKTALEGAGYTVDLSNVDESSWDGTNPSLSGYEAVIHLNGTTYNSEMPAAGQTALVNFVNGGGGFIHGEWNAYQVDSENEMAIMEPITLLERSSGGTGTRTYTVNASHPVVANLPNSFALPSHGYNIGTARTFSTNPSTVLATDQDQNPSDTIVVRSYGSGRVVGLANAGNYQGSTVLADSNMQQLYIDAVAWSAGCSSDTDADADGYSICDGDCDDFNNTIYPGANEECDGVDNDCDGDVDEDDAIDAITWYADTDADGYGDANSSDIECNQPTGYVADDTDCDDSDAANYPGADETCDGVDNDCDATVDEDDAIDVVTWYADSDGDGEGDAAVSDIDCNQPTGYVANDTDCDDSALELNTSDADADSYTSCDSDCNDTDATINIDATEVWYDGIDQNCDGLSDYDQDGDGFDSIDHSGDDCDDEDEAVNVEATEIWYDGIDQDCDALSDYDADLDGQDSATYGGEDCDDADPNVYTGAPDTPYDGSINDCLNADDYDFDGDGHVSQYYEGDDCDDANSEIYPSAEEIWYDGIDQDCDGNDADQDGDGYNQGEDCDDEDASSYPDNGVLDADCVEIPKGGCSSTGHTPKGAWFGLLAGLLLVRRKSPKG